MALLTWQRSPFWALLLQLSTQGSWSETPNSNLKKRLKRDFFSFFQIHEDEEANKKYIYPKLNIICYG